MWILDKSLLAWLLNWTLGDWRERSVVAIWNGTKMKIVLVRVDIKVENLRERVFLVEYQSSDRRWLLWVSERREVNKGVVLW